jgi:DNA-binding GntR family transcriptional regulator
VGDRVGDGGRTPSGDAAVLHSPIDLPSIPEVVHEALRRGIGRGIYPPGPIRVRTLAERFGVSATPVREALRRLEAEGLVTVRNRQILVNALSVEEMHEIYRIRVVLESFALRQSVARLCEDDDALAKLDSLIADMDRFERSPEEWRTANEEFHWTLYRAAEMPKLALILSSLWIAVEPYLRLYTSTVPTFRAAQQGHRLLLEDIRRGDADAATAGMRTHLGDTEAALAKAMGADAGL